MIFISFHVLFLLEVLQDTNKNSPTRTDKGKNNLGRCYLVEMVKQRSSNICIVFFENCILLQNCELLNFFYNVLIFQLRHIIICSLEQAIKLEPRLPALNT